MRRLTCVLVAIELAVLPPVASRPVSAQGPSPQEQALANRLKASNGISVGEPKVYDDALLQQMLGAAEARLAAIQVLDQAGIASKIGVLTGANQAATSVTLSVQTPALPEVSTVDKGATQQVVQAEAPAGTTTTTTRAAAATDVTTKAPSQAVPSATPAAPTLAMPSGLSVSASDLLNEQMQLTFEIANLRLMLDGAVSDRLFSTDSKLHRLKPRRTIGIPIDIDPKPAYKNAVAIVEVEVTRGQTLAEGAEISLTALLPREKTYNVAAIRENTLNLGGGLVTQVVGVGGGFLRSRKTYYIVQDQDTLAQTFVPEAAHTLGIGWQFRPVLGQEFVRPRQTQTFMQLAFPTLPDEADMARVKVRSYWRQYDRKHGVVKDVIPGSLNEKVFGKDPTLVSWSVPQFGTTIPTVQFNQSNLEDLGGGQMLITVPTSLLSGTSLRIGNTILKEGAPGVLYSAAGIRFAAPLADLATKRVALIGRNGEETPIQIARQLPAANGAGVRDAPAPDLASVTTRPIDDTTSLVEVTFRTPVDSLLPPPVLVVGGKVFGYSDAPILRSSTSWSVVMPTSLVQGNPEVEVTALLAPPAYRVSRRIEGTTPRSRAERIVLMAESPAQSTFLLYGSRLAGTKVLVPANGATLAVVPGAAAEDVESLCLLTITADALKGLKQVVVQRPGERPVFVPLPSTDAPKKPEPKPRERAVVGADAAVFDSDGLATFTAVSFEKRALATAVSADKKSVTVSGLKAAGITTAPGTATLEFAFGETKVQVTLEVVTARVETVAK